MVNSLELNRLGNAMVGLRAEIHDARNDVALLAHLATRLSRLGIEIVDAYERAFVVAIQASAA